MTDFEDVEVVALCDPVAAARDAVGDEFGVIRRYADVEELLDAEALDAVWVATPLHLNALVAQFCLERGINTFLEKPPGVTVTETQALRAAATRTGAKAMVGFNRRFHPKIVQAREMVAARGPVVQLVGEFHTSITRTAASGKYPSAVVDNWLIPHGIHAVDLVRAIAGSEVVEVRSVVHRALTPYKDLQAALVLFENGCLAHFIINHTTTARLERYEIHGRDISAYLEVEPLRTGGGQGVVFCDGQRHDLPCTPTGGTEEEDRYFLDCIADDLPVSLPAATLDESVKTMELAEAILAGLRDEPHGTSQTAPGG